ncbi:hypothetical protein [Rufibacter tibetensis]|uniref:Uncharacterized protein n=1 Tax=Rufibacter tibetensis TaxID=512763 RepID=A0A0P0CRX9_9BACT|nr:hypothetical protein [Rufibacter tibetensis]ALJ00199.1 hypothetical protein DC20_16035 [Rufibacter tibetensis]
MEYANWTEPGKVCLAVADNGLGIDPGKTGKQPCGLYQTKATPISQKTGDKTPLVPVSGKCLNKPETANQE